MNILRLPRTIIRGIARTYKNIFLLVRRNGKRIALGVGAVIILFLLWFVLWIGSIYFDVGRGSEPSHESQNNSTNVVRDVTGLYAIETLGILVPHTTEEIQEAVRSNDHVSIGGGRYSMGGQTASEKAVQIDMREFNKIISLSTSTKEITVQAGIRWRDIQEAIDPHGLSVQIMQTYSNFTVGGSLSVNVHGRYIGQGPVIMSVRKIEMVLADGTIVEATPDTNKELFYSAIGGMGGMGVITEVTLGLADNVNVERNRIKMSLSDYKDYFFENVRDSGDILFHNGDIYPMDFDSISVVNWKVTDKEPTTESRLIPRSKDYWLERAAWIIMSEWPFGNRIREYVFEPLIFSRQPVHTRNYEASYDVSELEPDSRKKSTYVLQEYFVPVDRFDDFYPRMKDVFEGNNVNLLNVSIRHANKDPGSVMAWAREEVFAFVVYYKQGTDEESRDHVSRWTREMIDEVIKVGGSYYLPYQPWATDGQFHRAYPDAIKFFELKNAYDPTNKFTNKLWETYYSPEKFEAYKDIDEAKSQLLLREDYVRNEDNIFITIPEWYIVYSAVEYANVLRDSLPSRFDYFRATRTYWSQFEKTQELATGSDHQNSDYGLVLQVIGWSFTLENTFKGIYENTVGRTTEWLAGGDQTREDKFAAEVAKAYADFIYEKPWYDFPYYEYYEKLGELPPEDGKVTLGKRIRNVERTLFLKFEYGAKRFYSWVIREAANSKFGISDDVICAIYLENETYGSLCAPHYQPFTRALVEKVRESKLAGNQIKILEIAGNSRITLVYLDTVGAAVPESSTEVLRHKEVVSVGSNGDSKYLDRITILLDVSELAPTLSKLGDMGISVDHIYDY